MKTRKVYSQETVVTQPSVCCAPAPQTIETTQASSCCGSSQPVKEEPKTIGCC